MVEVEQWAEIRRMHFVQGLSIKEISRRTGRGRATIRRALRTESPPRYERPPAASKLDPPQDGDPPAAARRAAHAGQAHPRADRRARLRRRPDDPRRLPARGAARCSPAAADLPAHALPPRRALPVRPLAAERGRSRSATARRAAAGWSSAAWATRAPAPARWSSPRQAPDMLWGITPLPVAAGRRCRAPSSGIARARFTAGAGGRASAFAAFCGRLRVGWHFCEPADPQAKGVVERLQGYMETSFEPGRSFANEIDFQSSSTVGSTRPTCAPTGAFAAGPRSPGRGAGGDAARCPARRRISTAASCMRVPRRPLRARRHLRLLARSAPCRPARRGAHRPARDPRHRARHGRARRPPPAQLRPPPHDHRPRAPTALVRAAAPAPSPRSSSVRSRAMTR